MGSCPGPLRAPSVTDEGRLQSVTPMEAHGSHWSWRPSSFGWSLWRGSHDAARTNNTRCNRFELVGKVQSWIQIIQSYTQRWIIGDHHSNKRIGWSSSNDWILGYSHGCLIWIILLFLPTCSQISRLANSMTCTLSVLPKISLSLLACVSMIPRMGSQYLTPYLHMT